MLEIGIRTTNDTKKLLKDMPGMIRKGLIAGMNEAMTGAAKTSQDSFGRAGKPNNITRTLRDSITRSDTKIVGNKIIASIGSNVIYARIHELGGKAGKGRLVKIPKREYLRPAIQDNLNKISELLQNSVWEEFQR